MAAHHIGRGRRDEKTERGCHARAQRNDHAAYFEQAGQVTGMDRPRAAKRNERIAARVTAFLRHVHASGSRHGLVHNAGNAECRLRC